MKLNSTVFVIFLFVATGFVYFSCSQNDECKSCTLEKLSKEEVEKQKVILGKKLFFDQRLSSDNSISCASCHNPELAFTDGKALSKGVGGRLGFRNAPTLLNLKDASRFMFDAEIKTLEEQVLVPIQDHAEMNIMTGDLVEKLKKDPYYAKVAQQLYNREFDAFVLTRSLASFQRTLISNNAPFDQFQASGDSSLLSTDALKGWELFNSFKCTECHTAPHFTDYQAHNALEHFNPEIDPGRFRVTADSSDFGSFKTPTLRNVELTAPYKHDGSVPDLGAFLYLHRPDTKKEMTMEVTASYIDRIEKENFYLIQFLNSLTDTTYLIKYR